MPYIQVDGTQHSLRVGETPVGTSADAGIRVAGPESLGVQALLSQAPDKTVSIRRASPTSVVKVNGVKLGAEPTPLIHGDKIEVAGREMLFGDEKKSGGTQMLSGLEIPDILGGGPATPARPTAATGGRLVSLVDGREYAVPGEGLTLGREAGCDVVVPGNDVSRRHADIAAREQGYVLSDSSTNGVFVNGERVRKTQLLGRGDVLRIGSEEFRFYADVPGPSMPTPIAPVPRIEERPAASRPEPSRPAPSPPEPSRPAGDPVGKAAAQSAARSEPAPPIPPRPGPAAPSVTPATPPPATPSPAGPPRPAAPEKTDHAPSSTPDAAAVPAAAGTPTPRHVPRATDTPPASRPVLATLEATGEGVHKGKRFELRLPLIHVGRGAHNDVAIPDESVSDTHAKLQKRDEGWFVVDMGSTNGTYVAGRRIGGEQRLADECDLRFGGIKMRFRAAAQPAEEARGTRSIAGVNVAEAKRVAAARPPAAEPAPPTSRGLPGYVWIIAIVLLGIAVYFILQGQGR